MCRHNAALPGLGTGPNNLSLHIGQLRDIGFNAKITARYHYPVSGLYDAVDIGHTFAVLNLGDDLYCVGFAPQQLAQTHNVLRRPDKRQRNIIDVVCGAKSNVFLIFVGNGGKVDVQARQVNVPATTQRTPIQYFTIEVIKTFAGDPQVHQSIVDCDAIALADGVHQIGIVNINQASVSLAFRCYRQAQGITLGQFQI